MSQRHNKRHRRWAEKPFAYRRALIKRATQKLKKDRGYLFVDYIDKHPRWIIWAHDQKNPVLIHKGRKP